MNGWNWVVVSTVNDSGCDLGTIANLWGAKVLPVGPRRGQPRLLHAYHVRQVLPTEILEQRVLIVRLAKPSQQRVRVPGDEAQWISPARLGD